MSGAITDDEIVAHLPIVRKLAGQAHQRNLSIEYQDFFGEGQIALIQAAQRWEPRVGVTFGTFVYYRIRGAMSDYVRATGSRTRSGHKRLETADYPLWEEFEESRYATVPETAECREVIASIGRLSPQSRLVALRCLVYGETHESVAADLGVTGARISQIVSAARDQLRSAA